MPIVNNTELQVPHPKNWMAIHTRLKMCSQGLANCSEPVPVPLILAGAAFSSAIEISDRWQATIQWAERYGCMGQLLSIYEAPPAGRDYAEEMAGVSAGGKGWWPDMTHWNREPRRKPSAQEVSQALLHLQEHWSDVVGHPLAAVTRPLAFTGRKSRRLLIQANPYFLPPWGTWLSCDIAPESFRAFRLAINSEIKPVEVDHVDFLLSIPA